MMSRRPGVGRDRPTVTFTFEGRTITARQGQSIAAALLANGVDILTRSFKYRRPRGYTCGFDACPNCPVTVDGLPGVAACTTEVRGGERVHRERGWPSADLDLLRVTDVLSRFFGAGFQFRHFAKHPRLSHLWERVMATVAGAGRLPTPGAARAAQARRVVTASPDVLVVGGGLSGCAAALGAAERGARVLLANRGPLGGRSRVRRHPVDTGADGTLPACEAAQLLARRVAAAEHITVVDGTVVGAFEEGVFPIAEGAVLREVRPRAVVVATGSYELPPLFPNNDRPGVVLADAVRRLIHVDQVVPWRSAVVVTDRAAGHELAAELGEAGVAVRAVADLRARPDFPGTGRVPVLAGARVARVIGRRRVRAIEIEHAGRRRRLPCDLVGVALGERPADELVLQLRYLDAGTTTAVTDDWRPGDGFSGRVTETAWVVGSAAGRGGDLSHAYAIGGQAAEHAARQDPEPPVSGDDS